MGPLVVRMEDDPSVGEQTAERLAVSDGLRPELRLQIQADAERVLLRRKADRHPGKCLDVGDRPLLLPGLHLERGEAAPDRVRVGAGGDAVDEALHLLAEGGDASAPLLQLDVPAGELRAALVQAIVASVIDAKQPIRPSSIFEVASSKVEITMGSWP